MKRYIRSSTSKSDKTVRNTLRYKGTRFRINSTDVSRCNDSASLFTQFKANISEIHPYDLAEYAWATLENGVVRYYKDGKLIDKTFYFNSDDMDIEDSEWPDAVITNVCDHLIKLNKNVEQRIDHT